MRVFEILLFGMVLIASMARLIPVLREKAYIKYLPFITGILVPVQLLVEGYRWQMVPLYVCILVCILVNIIQMRAKKAFLFQIKWMRAVSMGLAFLIYAVSFLLPYLLPVTDLPQPEGPYAVGTASFRLIDTEREELFTEEPDDMRNVLVKVWYPADIDKGMPVSSYWDKEGVTGRAYSINAGMGPFWYSHLKLVKTNSHPGAAVSAGEPSYPVIIYSPSFYGVNTENTMLCESLASYGYIVFGITHAYETIVSLYPDGEAVPGDLSHISTLYDDNADKEIQLYQDYEDTDDMQKKKEIVKEILAVDESSTYFIKARTEDAVYVLDEMERFNTEEGIFQSKLDLDRVGILGWSFGGATAEEACMADSRLKAGINIDGWPYGEQFAAGKSIAQPFMMIRSEAQDGMENIISELVYQKMDHTAYLLTIEGATHTNFWDFPLFFDVYKHIGYWGAIDARRLLDIHNTCTLGFFDTYLKGQESDWQAALSAYPEVAMEAKNME